MSVMPPRPSHMHAHMNPDAAALRQAPGSADMHQQLMLQSQAGQDVRAKMEDQVGQGQVAMNEMARAEGMNFDSQAAHANAQALAAKQSVLEYMNMKGVTPGYNALAAMQVG